MTDSALLVSLLPLPAAVASTLHVDCQWAAPEDLGTSSMAVEPGTPLYVSLDLTSVDMGVLVRVRCDVDLVGECVRCLDPVHAFHEVDATELYYESVPEGLEGEDVADVLLINSRQEIDIEPLLRDSIITLVDHLPLCRPDCQGLCQGCGEKLAELPPDHHHDVIDPRLASLAALLPNDVED